MNSDFPKAKVPLAPLLGKLANSLSSADKIASVLDIKYIRYTTSGRTAIALALKHANIQENQQVLIPAYHCEAMVAPAKWLNAKVIFYKIQRDTSVDIADIKEKINANTKALIVTHYFGFLQNLVQLRQLCDQNNIILIEDCAHAFFGEHQQHSIGKTGDYSIASSMKFLPLYDGGILCSETNNLDSLQLSAPQFSFQIKSLINIVEKSIEYKRLGRVGKVSNKLFKIKNLLWTAVKKIKHQQNNKIGPGSSEGGFGLDPEWIYKSCSLSSKWVIKHTDIDKTAYLRQTNYKKLHQTLSKLPNAHPLFTELPTNTVPFVYPLFVENPTVYFKKLKQLGVPIWRFGEYLDTEVTEKTCPISVEYSRHIFQFPCHQSLTEQELDWMISKIYQTLTES